MCKSKDILCVKNRDWISMCMSKDIKVSKIGRRNTVTFLPTYVQIIAWDVLFLLPV